MAKVLVYVSNLRLLGCFLLVYFGGAVLLGIKRGLLYSIFGYPNDYLELYSKAQG